MHSCYHSSGCFTATCFYHARTFYKVEVGGNQSVYVSTGNIRQSQFAEIVNQSSRDISIVSGMHGGPMEHY